ncbi:guanyl-specific ribonuclease f1 [Ceraceosorus bombacis]|uniref:Guanyl-specific ribonuclease f1 n=1 Tax=Ceraceosorus bombacis TaxID=401625 RepID=A0A0P1BBG4_9BASI|nr:guanyl-specific ribonuclease f1 [Ceraceosorus bombacis]
MKFAFALVALAAVAAAAPLEKRVSPNCGGKSFSNTNVNQAISNGVNDAASSSSYPHTYNNYEGFDFSGECSDRSYQEFPLVTKSGGYTGGSPGAYRVIYGTNTGNFCGAIYHASSDNSFSQCDY